MTQIAITLAVLALLATLGFAWAANDAAKCYFRRLIRRYPELAGQFPAPDIFTTYGPIWPSYMSYLKARKHQALDEPSLRRDGDRILRLMYGHAASFLVLVLSFLWWNYLKEGG